MSNLDTWPALIHNQEQHQKTSMILLMALLDESQKPGIFQRKLDEGLNNNGLPNIQYTPEPGTAKKVMEHFTGNNEITKNQNTNQASANNAQHSYLQNQPLAGTSRISTTTGFCTKFGRDTFKHEARQAALAKKTPIPKTGVLNIPDIAPQFVLQCATTKQGQQDLQQTISTMRNDSDDTDYHIANDSEVLAESTLNESSTSSENLTNVLKPNFPQGPIHRNYDYPFASQNFPTPNLDRYMAERQKIILPLLTEVIHMTPQKIFPDRETAIEYLQLIFESSKGGICDVDNAYCSQQLSLLQSSPLIFSPNDSEHQHEHHSH